MKKNKGFTLIELMVVMVLLAILVVAGIGSFTSSQKKGRDTKKKNDLQQVTLALEAYYSDFGRYPASDSQGRILGCVPSGTGACDWGDIFQADTDGSIYMAALPYETDVKRTYVYSADGSGTQYQLYARLENTLDGDIPKNASDEARVFLDLDCGTTSPLYCNYGVSSANITVEDGRTIGYE